MNFERKYAKTGSVKNYRLLNGILCALIFSFQSCAQDMDLLGNDRVLPGAYQTETYFQLLANKNLALVTNHTGVIDETHLVDTLLASDMRVEVIFAPEHGFRGKEDAGKKLESGTDSKTGLPIISLYGKHVKPTAQDLSGINMVVFDIQDVGARFYTYLSTLHYVMESCAELNIPLIVLDRPNPNGHYVDGPVLDSNVRSFVGLHPVPVVYGMTIGEYALMINGEGWLENQIQCELTVVKCKNYRHDSVYDLPIDPSPNLRSSIAISWYPSLCFFEGTEVSVGRGTDRPFEMYGHPAMDSVDFQFTPVPAVGASDPKHSFSTCKGVDLSEYGLPRFSELQLKHLLDAHRLTGSTQRFFSSPSFFDKLAGTKDLRMQILEGKSESEIRSTWKPGLEKFKTVRKKYLLYP